MVSSKTRAQRAMTWLCLVVAVLVSLLPAGGMTVCLGRDGHLGFGLGIVTTDGAESRCPCEHGAEVAEVTQTELLDATDLGHPPCDDLVLESPEVFKESGFAPSLAAAAVDLGGDDLPPLLPSSWALEGLWPEPVSSRDASWAAAANRMPRQLLELRRSVVLLI